MFKIVIVGTVMAMATAMEHPINADIVKDIKAKTSAWTPFEHTENPLRHHTTGSIYQLLGSHHDNTAEMFTPDQIYRASEVAAPPTNFDARTQWPGYVHPIRDQQSCGSCWAFGASEALTDRFSIYSNGAVNVILSPEDMVSCDSGNMGCSGGWLSNAWNYLESTGIVSDACFPYTAGSGYAPACATKCVDGSAFKKYKCKTGTVKAAQTQTDIQAYIQESGPLETRFDVYQDFFNYKSGVYHHVSGGLAGGHAIKILGWGVDSATGLSYWLCANSWNTTWGESGFFRIKVGDSGIATVGMGCDPDLASAQME